MLPLPPVGAAVTVEAGAGSAPRGGWAVPFATSSGAAGAAGAEEVAGAAGAAEPGLVAMSDHFFLRGVGTLLGTAAAVAAAAAAGAAAGGAAAAAAACWG